MEHRAPRRAGAPRTAPRDRRRSRAEDNEGIIPVLAKTVRRVEAAAARGKVRPSGRIAYQVATLLVRQERARVKADMIELHTGAYANAIGAAREAELQRLIAAGAQAGALGLQVNAGHGITTGNLPPLLAIPHLHELNIGHHIISRAIQLGLRGAVAEMLAAMRG